MYSNPNLGLERLKNVEFRNEELNDCNAVSETFVINGFVNCDMSCSEVFLSIRKAVCVLNRLINFPIPFFELIMNRGFKLKTLLK